MFLNHKRKILFVLSLFVFWPAKLVVNKPECSHRENQIIVLAKSHKLFLCEDSEVVKAYDVRLAQKGIGKKKAGDKKLPIGIYNLGTPRKSEQFGIFIPVGYPNTQERNQGYTGGSIGIHGPIRWARFLGSLVNWFDTTRGCIGIATDKEMKEIADWVNETKADVVQIK